MPGRATAYIDKGTQDKKTQMFKNLFTKKEYNSKTGFFKVDKEDLIPIDELEKGSINDCIETIGFPTNHIYNSYI